jgi:hypothetical protein
MDFIVLRRTVRLILNPLVRTIDHFYGTQRESLTAKVSSNNLGKLTSGLLTSKTLKISWMLSDLSITLKYCPNQKLKRIYASREGRKETSDILEGVDSNPQNTRRLV